MNIEKTLDFGDLGEWLCRVEFDYQPFEKPTATYPGCFAAIENVAVLVIGGFDASGDYDVTRLLIAGVVEELSDEIMSEPFERAEYEREAALDRELDRQWEQEQGRTV